MEPDEESCFEIEFFVTEIEELLEGRAKQLHHQSVVLALFSAVVDLSRGGCTSANPVGFGWVLLMYARSLA